MEFSRFDYALPGIWLPVAIFAAIIVGAFLTSRYLAAKKYHGRTVLFLWLLVLMLLLRGLVTYAQGFTYPISAALQTDTTQYITVGCVEQVGPAPCPPIYFDPIGSKFGAAKLVTVDGVQFYLPYCDIEIGQTVQLRWANEEHVVYAYQILPDGGESKTYSIEMPAPQQNPLARIGQTLALVSAGLLLLQVVLQYSLGKKMTPYFAERDRKTADRIIPNRFGLLYVCALLLPMAGILGGLALKGFTGALLILLAGTVLLGRLALIKQTTMVSLEENTLVVKHFGSVRRIGIESVAQTGFVASRLPGNRCLQVTLKNGTVLRFEQENFYGLESMHKKLRRLVAQNQAAGK